MKQIFYILILFTAVSCVVPRNYPKAKWKVDKIVDAWPEVLENDTTIIEFDSLVITPKSLIDTVFTAKENDTIYIEKDRLRIRFIRGKRDTFYVTGECLPDTVRINVKIPVPVYTIEEKNLKSSFNWWWVIAVVSFIILISFVITKIRKKIKRKS